MSKHLEIPAELLSLIEKREQADRRQPSDEPAAAAKVAAEALELDERRQATRRADDRDAD